MFPEISGTLTEFLARISGRKKEEPTPKTTAKPVAVREIWGWSGENRRISVFSSVVVHVLFAFFLVVAFKTQVKPIHANHSVILYSPVDISPYIPKQSKGGGGGGDRSPAPASKGVAPRFDKEQYTPPAVVIRNENPKLAMEPTLVGPPELKIPQPNMNVWGDPLAGVIGPPSSGPGSGGGIGSGRGGGVGPGSGPGLGPGSGGGFGGGAFRAGISGVSPPQLIYKVEPEYTEEARKARYQGTVVLLAVVGADGNIYDARVIRSLGLGLDEQAIIAVKQWKFKPGFKDGKPIPVIVSIETTFRLL